MSGKLIAHSNVNRSYQGEDIQVKTKNNPSPDQRLKRLKWIILILSVLIISLVEIYHFFGPERAFVDLFSWLAGTLGAVLVIYFAFREIEKSQTRLDIQLNESQIQVQRQAVLIQLGLKLTPTLDPENIIRVVANELRHSMGYSRVEINLNKNTPKERRPPASPFYDPSKLEFPLQTGRENLGTLLVESGDSKALGTQDHAFLSAVANQTALAIVNSRLLESQRNQRLNAENRESELRRQQHSLNLLNEITQSALQSPDLASMLQTITEDLGILFEADCALLALWDETNKGLALVGAYATDKTPLEDMVLNPGDLSLAETAIASGQPVVVKDTSKSLFINSRLAERLQIHSLLALPLTTTNQKLGIALITFKQRHSFTKREINLGDQAANQIALAIAKARALELAQDRAHELDALQRATSALLSTLDLENLLGQILDASISAIPATQRGAVYLIAHDTGQLQMRAVQNPIDTRIRAFDQTTTTSYTVRSVRERKPLLILDGKEGDKAKLRGEDEEQPAIASAIIAPLVFGKQTLGAITLESIQQNAFTEADLELLVSFAATATTAIQNAQLHAEVQRQAITDTLTGFYNRRGFIELGHREVERALRFGHPLSALMLDIDLFKQINDLHGHLIGDRVLVGLTNRCAQELRQIDLLGRYGGDEFVVLLPETSLENARCVAERLRMTAANIPIVANGTPLQITISVGVAALDEKNKSLEKLMDQADQALYQAKEAGRDKVVAV